MDFFKNVKNKGYYKVYVLWQNDLAIYIGVTTDIENRIRAHKKKNYTHYSIIECFKDRKEAYSVERCIIKFMSISGTENMFLNSTKPKEISVVKHRVFYKNKSNG